ncbi:multidrug efflux pump subunit AcrB [Inhella inkyongensis]|uniref:Multidrug efflux pump subunit AcrB n=1 Tax=Inhella inkyongensis TaxID=392593 RepID=A0A840S7X9_9BURK|nr:efflux RND transporter permease subunit [Inhella inkyongensis]MBB5204894.1 multidrug efflux pump subunit AcrB [Inhella inkyongensis]
MSRLDEGLGLSGRIAAFFQGAQITPLLALVGLLLGLFAVAATPREEEPQINVTMANVLVALPGASVADVEALITIPGEQVLSRIAGVEHVMAVARPGQAVLTVQFKVGVPRTEALVRLQDTVQSHADWLPPGLGASPPLIKPLGIDDVPILSLTLHSADPEIGPMDLERVARGLESELKRVPGTRDIQLIGGPGRRLLVALDPERMNRAGLSVAELRQALQGAHQGAQIGERVQSDHSVMLEAGPYLRDARKLEDLIVGVQAGRPVALRDVADVREGSLPGSARVWHRVKGQDRPALTLAITKKAGENAIDVARALQARVAELRGTLLPSQVEVEETRNYGQTADEKARQLIQKLLFATASVVALVFLALGRREAAIVGAAVILTLAATLFASWAWGFTLNRVSLFALIFSIGILVDDAIVVVENIHRHLAMNVSAQAHIAEGDVSRSQNMARLIQIIPRAVDEVGGPTILATFTVIAALLPMAFVSGLMGPYMAPIPINASMGMLISLAIAFVVTPWLARLLMKALPAGQSADPEALHGLSKWLAPHFERLFGPLLDAQRGARNRRWLGLGVAGLIVVSLALPGVGAVLLKMLPFDNKSELQVMVDMPAGTPVERTAAVLQELGVWVGQQPEVRHLQAYAGASAPINFNGLVRQYFLRTDPHQGDLAVNLAPKSERKEQSHDIATRWRPELQRIARRHGANLKVVEVPPGPPVLAPLVAEIYGPEASGRAQVAAAVRKVLEGGEGVVDVDDSGIAAAPRERLVVDQRKAALLGVPASAIVSTLQAAQQGDPALWLHDGSRRATSATLILAPELLGEREALLSLGVKTPQGKLVPLRELVTLQPALREAPAYRKDGLPVHYVVGDMAGRIDSPLYGLFSLRGQLGVLPMPDGGRLQEFFIRPPSDPYRGYSLKWDGEWQITYETFRDMGLAYAVGLVLIYLLVVAQFKSYLTPLVIMAPIPLTVVGVMPGHALLGAPFTATSMIGMIALAGIIVRNSILLVDFINLQVRAGMAFEAAIQRSAITRAQPILLTGLAAMLGAFFILDDPIFNGLAISLIFGIAVSTVLTLVVIPILYFVAYRHRLHLLKGETP